MKTKVWVLTFCLGMLGSVASAAPCLGTQPLSGLLALPSTGCTVGDKLFTNFSLTQDGTLAGLDADLINVLTSTTPQGNEVLTFIGGLTAVGGLTGGTLESIIGYTVQTVSGAALIEDLSLSVGPLTEVGTGPNSATVTEFACIGVNIACNGSNADFTLTATPNGAPQQIVFPPVTSLSVAKRLNITAAAANLVTLNSVTNEVSQVQPAAIPEPGTYALLFSGLGFLAFARKYRTS